MKLEVLESFVTTGFFTHQIAIVTEKMCLEVRTRFCPGVPVHKGITIVVSLFRSHWLAVVYCLVFCIGSCEPVHEDRTQICEQRQLKFPGQINSTCCSLVLHSKVHEKMRIYAVNSAQQPFKKESQSWLEIRLQSSTNG